MQRVWQITPLALGVLCFSGGTLYGRIGLVDGLQPVDLLILRFGSGALLFLPVLVIQYRLLTKALFTLAAPLSFTHGWGMAGATYLGLQFAPASHASALGPGCVPLWILVVSYVALGRTAGSRQIIGATAIFVGALLLATTSGASTGQWAVVGDALFLFASCLAAIYFVTVDVWRVPVLLGNAIVICISGFIICPVIWLTSPGSLHLVDTEVVAVQAVAQGLLFSIGYLLLHYCALTLGPLITGIGIALGPIVTLALEHLLTRDRVGSAQVACIILISVGVVISRIPARSR